MLAHLAHPRAVEGRATGVVLRALGEEAERTPVGLGAPCPVCFYDLEALEDVSQSLQAIIVWAHLFWTPRGT